jgi:glycerate kinase
MTVPGTSNLRVLIAPDCFGDSLTAAAAARAIAAGWSQARPADTLVLAPQSDGGPGFVEVLAAGHPGIEIRQARVRGPLAEDVDADWAFDPATATAYIESAQACGLHLLPSTPTPQTAWAAHTFGVGQLIGAACAAGARTIVVGLGGSACTDGGRGMIDALGGLMSAVRTLAGVELIAATDVEHRLLGPTGAAHVFGPQKGADPATVERLDARLADWAEQLQHATGRHVPDEPGAGAAGGLGAALLALGARRVSGAELLNSHTGTSDEVARCNLLITGEGRFDEQTLNGKVVGSLAALARGHNVPVLVLAGQVALPPAVVRAAGVNAAYALADHAGSVQRAIDEAAAQLTGMAARAAGELAAE